MLNSQEYIVEIKSGEYYEGIRETIKVINGQLYRVNPHNNIYLSYDRIDEKYIDMLTFTPLRRLLCLIHYNKEEVIKAITILEFNDEMKIEVNSTIPIEGRMVEIEGLTVSIN